MEKEYNSMYFTKEDVEAGFMHELLTFLCRYSYHSGPRDFSHYNDIQVYPADCEAFVVEWVQLPWSHTYGGGFQYVGEEQEVCDTNYSYDTQETCHVEWG